MTCPGWYQAENIINMFFLRRLLSCIELNAYCTTGELKINVFFPLSVATCNSSPFVLSTVLSNETANWFLFFLAGHLHVEIKQIISKDIK